jgi:hypothetical protein
VGVSVLGFLSVDLAVSHPFAAALGKYDPAWAKIASRSAPAFQAIGWVSPVVAATALLLLALASVAEFSRRGMKLRLYQGMDLAWRPADAVLCSRTLSNLFVGGPVIVTLFAIVRHDGRFGLVADIQDSAALGGFLYGVIRTGRWWRGVKPPEPKARRVRD